MLFVKLGYIVKVIVIVVLILEIVKKILTEKIAVQRL